ncbi:MAG: elongation factor P [bacterium]|nr:elongation factor P [bacterium]
MLEYNEILKGRFIILDKAPYEVLDARIFRMQQRKPVNQTKLKNIITGKVTERTFGQSEKAEEADLEKREIKYLYNNKGQWWFCEANDPSKRFQLSEELLGQGKKFLKANSLVTALYFNEEIIGVSLPIKVELKVVEAAPAVKGNTVQGGTKQVTLETGATVNTPMFVKEGDVLRINTETGEYVERV